MNRDTSPVDFPVKPTRIGGGPPKIGNSHTRPGGVGVVLLWPLITHALRQVEDDPVVGIRKQRRPAGHCRCRPTSTRQTGCGNRREQCRGEIEGDRAATAYLTLHIGFRYYIDGDSMKASITTFVIGVGIFLALIAVTFGIWFYPEVALLALVLVPLGARLSEKYSDKLSRRHGCGSTQSETFRQTPVGGGERRRRSAVRPYPDQGRSPTRSPKRATGSKYMVQRPILGLKAVVRSPLSSDQVLIPRSQRHRFGGR